MDPAILGQESHQEIILTVEQKHQLELLHQRPKSPAHHQKNQQEDQKQLESPVERGIKESILRIEVSTYWQFAAICQFFWIYQEAFGLDDFDTLELEKAFLYPHENDWIQALQAKMLRMATKNRFAQDDVWLLYAEREINKRHDHDEEPSFFVLNLEEPLPVYEDLALKTRVLILHFICELQLERIENFKPYNDTSEIEAAKNWRVESIGNDSSGNTYWVFDDARLYIQNGSSKKEEWRLACSTQEEWKEFPEQFKNSKSKSEKELYTFLLKELVPAILKDLKEAEDTRIARKKRLEEEENSRIAAELEEIEKQELENIRLALELEKNRYTTRSFRVTRQAHEPQAPKTAAEIREERMMKRQQRIEEQMFEEVPVEIFNETSADTANSEPKKRGRKNLKKRPRKKGYVYSDEEGDNEEEDYGDESEELYDEQDLIPSSSTQPKRKVGRPRKYPLSQDVGEDDVWYFDCVCGISGQNIDDGTPIVSCESCSVWAHIQCAISEEYPKGHIDIQTWKAQSYKCKKCRNDSVLKIDLGPLISPNPKSPNGTTNPSSKITHMDNVDDVLH